MKNLKKQIRNINRSLVAAILCMLLISLLAGTCIADDSAAYPAIDTQRPVSLTVTANNPDDEAPISNLRLSLYKVADIVVDDSGAVDFTLTPAFADARYEAVEMNLGQYDANGWADGAITLSGYVLSNKEETTYEAVTDENGQASFGNVDQGLYLMISTYEGSDYTLARVTPVYLTLPAFDGNEWVYDAVSRAKPEVLSLPPETEPGSEKESESESERQSESESEGQSESETEETNVGVSVKKVWSGDDTAGVSERRPASITVDLLDENGNVIDTQELNVQNGWAFSWTGLPQGQWSVVEKNVPEGYSVSIEEQSTDDGKAVTITNTTPPAGVKGVSRERGSEDGSGTNNSGVKGANRNKDKNAGVKGSYREGDTANVASQSTLPQTGQLWWPVWVLSAIAAVMVLIGLLLRLSGGRDLKD